MTKLIKLNTVDECEHLAVVASSFNTDEKIILEQYGNQVDARSAMSIFSFNLLQPMFLSSNCEDIFNDNFITYLTKRGEKYDH